MPEKVIQGAFGSLFFETVNLTKKSYSHVGLAHLLALLLAATPAEGGGLRTLQLSIQVNLQFSDTRAIATTPKVG